MFRHARSRSHVVPLIAVFGASAALGACATGERPTLVSAAPVGDPAIEAVLENLAHSDTANFTATYEIIPSLTGEPTEATVERSDSDLTVTIGGVEFRVTDDAERTCSGQSCVDELDDARVSDLNITHRFWGPSFEERLELDASRNVDDGIGSTATIADQPATCVNVALIGGTVTYCALDDGPLARYFGADVSIELTSYSPVS